MTNYLDPHDGSEHAAGPTLWRPAGADPFELAGPRPAWRLPLASAWLSVLVVTCLATLSRSGLLVLAIAALVTIAPHPGRVRGTIALVAGGLGAALPALFVLTSDPLLEVAAGEAARTDAGLGLGWRLAVGAAIAAVLAAVLERGDARRRTALGATARGAAAIAALALLALGGTAPSPASGDGVRPGPPLGPAAIGNETERLASGSLNNRARWWEEALSGWRESPVTGQGAGGFRIVQLAEREDAVGALRAVEPHQALFRTLSGTGLVGLLLLCAAAVGAGWGALRAARRAPWAEVGAPIAILVAVVLQSLVDWTLAIPALAVAGAATAGVLIARARPGQRADGAPALRVFFWVVGRSPASRLMRIIGHPPVAPRDRRRSPPTPRSPR